jgi:hypothetical protein
MTQPAERRQPNMKLGMLLLPSRLHEFTLKACKSDVGAFRVAVVAQIKRGGGASQPTFMAIEFLLRVRIKHFQWNLTSS